MNTREKNELVCALDQLIRRMDHSADLYIGIGPTQEGEEIDKTQMKFLNRGDQILLAFSLAVFFRSHQELLALVLQMLAREEFPKIVTETQINSEKDVQKILLGGE
jgi:hypothetical protein